MYTWGRPGYFPLWGRPGSFPLLAQTIIIEIRGVAMYKVLKCMVVVLIGWHTPSTS